METDPIKTGKAELEEGEISDSEDLYIPLSRPELVVGSPGTNFTMAQTTHKVRDPSSSEENFSSDSSEDSDAGVAGTKRKKRKEIRVKPMKPVRPVGRVRPEKYNIWAQTLQDDLMENMKGCEVRNDARDRDVESYDYLAKYRLNGESVPTKRRQSYSDDSDTYNKMDAKRHKEIPQKRISAKLRLGPRVSEDSCNSSDGVNMVSRHILDLTVTRDSTNEEVAQDIAHKLAEEKDDLLFQAISVIGKELPMKLFMETQKIEKDGGMMTVNGQRRRTPGGVFLFLLKNCSGISEENKKQIFYNSDDRREGKKKRKDHDKKRDRKVEELKKTLNLNNVEKDSRDGSNTDTHNPSLSNPPPSPVTDGNRESSPDIETTKIVNNLAANRSIEGESSKKTLCEFNNPYDDDLLDMTCDDMDLF